MKNKNAENILQMPVSKTGVEGVRQSDKKWGKAVMAVRGFCLVPSLLLHAQKRLKITPVQFALIMHLADYWWMAEKKPFPSKSTLGDRVGLSARQVQRHMATLEEMGLLTRVARSSKAHGGKMSNEYDLSGLVKRLKELEPEFKAVDEETEIAKKAVTRPGFKDRKRKE